MAAAAAIELKIHSSLWDRKAATPVSGECRVIEDLNRLNGKLRRVSLGHSRIKEQKLSVETGRRQVGLRNSRLDIRRSLFWRLLANGCCRVRIGSHLSLCTCSHRDENGARQNMPYRLRIPTLSFHGVYLPWETTCRPKRSGLCPSSASLLSPSEMPALSATAHVRADRSPFPARPTTVPVYLTFRPNASKTRGFTVDLS